MARTRSSAASASAAAASSALSSSESESESESKGAAACAPVWTCTTVMSVTTARVPWPSTLMLRSSTSGVRLLIVISLQPGWAVSWARGVRSARWAYLEDYVFDITHDGGALRVDCHAADGGVADGVRLAVDGFVRHVEVCWWDESWRSWRGERWARGDSPSLCSSVVSSLLPETRGSHRWESPVKCRLMQLVSG